MKRLYYIFGLSALLLSSCLLLNDMTIMTPNSGFRKGLSSTMNQRAFAGRSGE